MTLSRRQLLIGLAGAGSMAAGASLYARLGTRGGTPIPAISAENHRMTGKLRKLTLRAQPTQVDLGGTIVDTWTYGDTIPGTLLRATAGDRMQIAFSNALPEATSVHWHGLAIRNDMDGVPHTTTAETPSGGGFDFDFVVPDAGTHWFHPHTGLQMDRGLYAPFIVDDPNEPGAYDAEWIVVLDDWTDGVGPSPEQNLANLKAAGANGDGHMMGMGSMGMNDGGDVTYPFFLMNGRTPNDPESFSLKPGHRVRIRIINASADTIYTVALGGHRLTVTHGDGFPVQAATTSALRIGMGERYDVVVTLGDGVFPLVALPYGKDGLARALVRTGSGEAPAVSAVPGELHDHALTSGTLRVAQGHALPAVEPTSTQELLLAGSMAPYVWTINGEPYESTVPLTIREGELTRINIRNMSMMSHPVHTHGHTFQLGAAGGSGARKDTVLVPPMGALSIDLLGDNPGRWMIHCHNVYHAEAGMMTRLEYVV